MIRSGTEEEVSEKTELLDQVLELYEDYISHKTEMKEASVKKEMTEKEKARKLRDDAMKSLSGKSQNKSAKGNTSASKMTSSRSAESTTSGDQQSERSTLARQSKPKNSSSAESTTSAGKKSQESAKAWQSMPKNSEPRVSVLFPISSESEEGSVVTSRSGTPLLLSEEEEDIDSNPDPFIDPAEDKDDGQALLNAAHGKEY